VTICFNEEKKIEETCKSVREQTCKDFEWIVLDGKSTDNTTNILKKYKKNMSSFVSEKDSGRYNAMNKGIKKSKGEYLIFLHGGDFFKDKNVLQKIKDFIEQDKKSSEIYYGDLQYDNGEIVSYKKSVLDKKFFITKTISHQATFIQKNLLKKIGFYNEKYRIVADFDFWIRAIVLNKVKTRYLPLTISVFDQEGLSTTYKMAKKQIAERNEVLLKYKLITEKQAKLFKVRWFILSFFKRLGIYNFLRRNYRKVVKR
jgi:glycosyltransferase involved in cell wall biosynthesis